MRIVGGARSALASLTLAAVVAPALVGVAMEGNVTVVDNAFDPRQITVTAGHAVVWRWSGGNENPHTVTALDGSFDSDAECDPEDLSPCRAAGHTFSVVLTEPGTYAYRCRIHPITMVGTVEVVAAEEGPGEEGPAEEDISAPPNAEPSEDETRDDAPPSPSPTREAADGETGSSSAPARSRAGPPGFGVGQAPSQPATGNVDDPVVASPPPSSAASSPFPDPTAAASGSPAAIDLSDRPGGSPRRALMAAAAGLVLLGAAALGRFVIFGRRW
ncbi:MAG: plastocyanin/azurin family copper-binding protein [Nitriliruptorales bacterium]